MLFYEPLFLTIFPVVYAFQLMADRAQAKKWSLLIASVLFYVWGEPAFVILLLLLSAIDYQLSLLLNDKASERKRRLVLVSGVTLNLLVLVVYKYADFFASNLNSLIVPSFGRQIPLLNLVLPIGLSFVVFEK